MKDFLSYLPLIAIAGVVGYIFFKELVIIAIIILVIIFRNEILGLGVLAQILSVVIGIPYLFFTDSQFRSSILILALFFCGIFLIGYLADKYEKSKENNETDSSTINQAPVNHREKIESEIKTNPSPNVRSHYNDTTVRNNNPRSEILIQSDEVPTEFYRVAELQSRFEKWLTTVENARAENKWKYGRDYERYIGYLFEREGFQVIYNGATLGSSDGGIDLFCFKDGIVYPIQCKRWKNKVDEDEIDKFVKAVAIFKLNRSSYNIPLCYSKVVPIFYTTNGYTDYARWKARDADVICRVQKFNSIREYPAVKCTLLNRRKVYYLPFDKDFDSIHVGVYRGGCFKFSVLEAEHAGFHHYTGLPLEDKAKSHSENYKYWQDEKNFACICFHSGYWEFVDLKSCKIICKNADGCLFSAKFIGVMNNTPPKVIKTGETMFRQRKSNDNLPEFYDDKEKLWITLPKSRRMLQSECMVEYYNATRPFQNNMFRIVYRQLFKCDYIDPR